MFEVLLTSWPEVQYVLDADHFLNDSYYLEEIYEISLPLMLCSFVEISDRLCIFLCRQVNPIWP